MKGTNRQVQLIYQKPGVSDWPFLSERLENGRVWGSNGLLKKAPVGKLNGIRPRGRPRHRRADRIKNDLFKCTREITIENNVDRDGRTDECSKRGESPSRTVRA